MRRIAEPPRALRKARSFYLGRGIALQATGIPFVVVGGVATRLYMPERTTADLDLLIEPEHFNAALEQLALKATGENRDP